MNACQQSECVTVPIALLSCAQYVSLRVMLRSHTQWADAAGEAAGRMIQAHGIYISHYEAYILDISRNYQSMCESTPTPGKQYDILGNLQNLLDLCQLEDSHSRGCSRSHACLQTCYDLLCALSPVSYLTFHRLLCTQSHVYGMHRDSPPTG